MEDKMSNFGWSYPAGCSGTPYDEHDVERCHQCGVPLAEEDPGVSNPLGSWGRGRLDSVWQDGYCSCRCLLAAGETESSALPMPVVRGLAKREPDYSVAGFCWHIGCGETLRENLRAIDKHNLEHVWVVLEDGRRIYYHDHETLDAITGHERVRAVGAGCIAWDGSDWEYSTEDDLASYANHEDGVWAAVDACRAACIEAYEEYTYEQNAERFCDAVQDLRERGCAVRVSDDYMLAVVTVPPGVSLDVTEDLEYAGWVPVIGPRRETSTGIEVGFRPE
jgi:hypothetical protein